MANSGPYYPVGRYLCEITDQGLTKASTGNTQVVLRFRVIEGLKPTADVQQYTRTAYLPATEKTMEYLVPKLEALGYTRDSLRHLDLNDSRAHDLRGTHAEFYCKHENDLNGELREKWDVAMSQGGKPLELKPPDAKDVRQLDALFGRAKKAFGGAPPAPAVSKPTLVEPPDWAEANAAAGDEEIAF